MKVSELFKYAIEKGMENDPRGKTELDRILKESNEAYEKLPDDNKWEYDQERLWNPYADSRILNNPDDPEVSRVLMGINIDSAELLLADRLREKGEGIDAVIGHHPRGTALPGLHEVMGIQVDFYKNWGIPVNVGEQLLDPRVAEVMRGIMPANHQQPVDTARLLGIPFMCTHSPSDIMVHNFLIDKIQEAEPRRISDILDLIKAIPEFKTAVSLKNGPRVIAGKKDGLCGKVVVKMAGGTSGPKNLYEAMKDAGVGTYICMHMPEAHIEVAKEHHINVVISGHMPSDSVGMNLLYSELEREGKLEVVRMSGLIGPE